MRYGDIVRTFIYVFTFMLLVSLIGNIFAQNLWAVSGWVTSLMLWFLLIRALYGKIELKDKYKNRTVENGKSMGVSRRKPTRRWKW